MEDKQNLSQVDKLTIFKSRLGKVILGQTIGRFTVISPNNK